MTITTGEYLTTLLERIRHARCQWHGLFEWNPEWSHQKPDPDTYGLAPWNVRLVLRGEPNEGDYGYGGGPSLELAIERALIDVADKRQWRPKVTSTGAKIAPKPIDLDELGLT